MSSSRLPGKVLLDINGKPMLQWVFDRTCAASLVDQVCVATTDDPRDDAIQEFCEKLGYPFFRGSQYDVLDRYYQAARALKADAVVRITADCPLIDPQLIDLVIGEFLEAGVDFCANRLPPPFHRTFPIGLDTEVADFSALEQAWREADQPYEREHVMPYLYDREGRFKVRVVDNEVDYGMCRWCVDTLEDLEFVRRVTARLIGQPNFGWLDILDVLQREPELTLINQEVRHKTMVDVDDRIGGITKSAKRTNMEGD